MAIYSLNGDSLQRVEPTTFSSEGILERQHLQAAIKHNIKVVAPDCLVISEEFSEWSDSQRRIDLLAVDKEGNLVVIELKRTETGEHMDLQALRYAAMVSTLTFSRASEIYQDYLSLGTDEGSANSTDSAENKLLDFLGWEEPQEDDFALNVRIVLVSANFSKEITTSVMWLNEKGLDIRCVRLIPYKYTDQILIDVQQIIPLPEVENYQVKIRQQAEERREAKQSSKDYTRYQFQEESFNKRKLVLAVIQRWISDNNPIDISELLQAFPQETRPGGGLFALEQEAKETYEKYNIRRHFLEDQELIEFSDSGRYAISNQWGRGNIESFIHRARALGYEIDKVS